MVTRQCALKYVLLSVLGVILLGLGIVINQPQNLRGTSKVQERILVGRFQTLRSNTKKAKEAQKYKNMAEDVVGKDTQIESFTISKNNGATTTAETSSPFATVEATSFSTFSEGSGTSSTAQAISSTLTKAAAYSSSATINVSEVSWPTSGDAAPYTTTFKESLTKEIEAPIKSTDKLSIPHNIWFIHETDILETTPGKDYNNVKHIVDSYRYLWKKEDAPVNFLNTEHCKELVSNSEKDLLPFYESSETDSWMKDDICRLSALYVHGGYYFNTDIDAIGRLGIEERTKFVITKACDGSCFFQGFIATSPKHPILRGTLKIMLDEYRGDTLRSPVSRAMYQAYTNLSAEDKEGVRLLEELELDYSYKYGYENKLYPSVHRQHGKGQCNIAIHDPDKKIIYFFEHYLGSRGCKRGVIPHELWFSYKNNVMETRTPEGIYNNVIKTIEKYRSFWEEPKAPVHFLDDRACREAIQAVFPKLLPHFDLENAGSYKGDICRNSAIYNDGGYYFDVDIQVVSLIEPKPRTTFLSTLSCGGGCFFQAFFACTPKHPIIWGSLEKMLQIYETKADNLMLGPITMANAYHELPYPDREEDVELLRELQLDAGKNPEHYPSVPRQPNTGNCNWVVHDPEKEIIYFFARFTGYGGCQADPATHQS